MDDSAYYGRRLAGISSIDFIADKYGNKGAITGLTSINGVIVAGTSASTGLTIGGNAIIGKMDMPFSSEGFSVSNTGALTAGGITLEDGVISWNDSSKGILIGSGRIGAGALAIGSMVSVDYDTSIGIGQAIANSAEDSVLIGYDSYILEGADRSVVLGEGSSISSGYSKVIDSSSTIYDESAYSIIMGNSSIINSYSMNSTIIGNGSTIESDSINSIVLGSDIYVNGSNNVALGYGSGVKDGNGSGAVNNSLALGAGSQASVDNQVNFGYYRFDADGNLDDSAYYGRSLAGAGISDITIVDGDQLDADNTNKITITGSRITIGGDAANQTVIENGTINSSKINGMNIF